MRALILLIVVSLFVPATAAAQDWSSLMQRATRQARAGNLSGSEKTLRRALALLDDTKPDEMAYTREALASILAPQGRHQEAIQHYTGALVLREKQRPRLPEIEAETLLAIASSQRFLHQMDEAVETAKRAVKRAGDAGPGHVLVLAKARRQLGLAFGENGQTVEGQKQLQAALATFRSRLPPSHRYVAQCHLSLGWIQYCGGEWVAAEKSLATAQRLFLATEGKNSKGNRRARHCLALVMGTRGKLNSAEQELRALVSSADRAGVKDETDAQVRATLAGMLLDRGVIDGVDRLLERSEKLAPVSTRICRGQLSALSGRWEEAGRQFAAAEKLLEKAPTRSTLLTRVRAEALIREGRTKEARSLLVKRAAMLRQVRCQVQCLLAACSLEEGRHAEAAASARAAIAELTEMRSGREDIFAKASVYLGKALIAAGDDQNAREHLQRARKRIDGLGAPWVELKGECLFALGRLERAAGDTESAKGLLRESADSFRKGAPLIRRQAAEVLAELAELHEAGGDGEGAAKIREEIREL